MKPQSNQHVLDSYIVMTKHGRTERDASNAVSATRYVVYCNSQNICTFRLSANHKYLYPHLRSLQSRLHQIMLTVQ